MKTTPAYTNSIAATLTVAAILGLSAGAKTAKAWDQQASEAAMSSQLSSELSHRAAQVAAPRHAATGAYASAHAEQRGSGGAQRDFHLEGR